MVMNKKEKKRLEELERENEGLKLQILGQSKTRVPEPFVWDYDSWKAQGEKLVQGWSFNAVLSSYSPFRVYRLWSKGVVHYTDLEGIGSQGSGVLYRTEEEALLAARALLQANFDAVIASLDRQLGRLEDVDDE